LLLCVRGSTTGRTNIAAFRACIGRGVAAVQALFQDQFVRLYVVSRRQAVIEMGRGIAFPSVSRDQITNLVVPLPPLPEQHRIVAKVDELMALCDRLEAAQAKREQRRDRLNAASLNRIHKPAPSVEGEAAFREHARFHLNNLPRLTTRPEHIKSLRQTILDLAVRGRLVPQDPEEGDGRALFSLLRKERATWEESGRIRKEKGYRAAILDEEKYLDVPQAWAWARLLELGQTQTGTSPSSANPDLFGGFIPFVKPADLDGKEINYGGPGLSESGMACSRLAAADSVLMVCIGATLGKVNRTTRPICFNQQINSLTPFLDGLSEYLALALKTSGFQALAWSKAGTGTLPIISKGKWEILPVPLPPLAEQYRIVAKVDELMAVCDQLEAQLTTTQTDSRRLLEAVLHEAVAPAMEEAA
jgi:type I restriction enzyme, S subunit